MAETRRRSLRELGDLTGRNALVAGGAGRIGEVAVEALSEAGATVLALDLKPGAADLVCDLSDEAETRAAVRESVARLGGLDVLVHCAALVGTTRLEGWAVPFRQQSVAAWDAAMRVNVTSAFVLVQEAADALAASGHGSVVLVGSTYGVTATVPALYEGTEMENPFGYGASKAGLLQLARYLATTLGPQVRVNAISPGGIERGQPEIFQARYRERTPLERMATEEDMKGAFAYLASDLSAYVTGHNLLVDGGWTAW